MPAYVARTVRTLELACQGAISAAQLADALGVDVRTARALLNRLVDEELLVVTYAPRPRYSPGPRLLRLGVAAGGQPLDPRPRPSGSP
jgi:DNA-binding IclR family transcriptional regulator